MMCNTLPHTQELAQSSGQAQGQDPAAAPQPPPHTPVFGVLGVREGVMAYDVGEEVMDTVVSYLQVWAVSVGFSLVSASVSLRDLCVPG